MDAELDLEESFATQNVEQTCYKDQKLYFVIIKVDEPNMMVVM